MRAIEANLVSILIGFQEDMSKQPCHSVNAQLDGFEGDKHRGYSRVCYEGDTEPCGTVRRNNRQWSAVSLEELKEIQEELDLARPLLPGDLGVNLCIEGVDGFSRLTKGSRLVFPSGATLMVEDYNPPCTEMGDKIAKMYVNRAGEPLSRKQFLIAAKRKRGLVGVVDVPGIITTGDKIMIKPYSPPKLAQS